MVTGMDLADKTTDELLTIERELDEKEEAEGSEAPPSAENVDAPQTPDVENDSESAEPEQGKDTVADVVDTQGEEPGDGEAVKTDSQGVKELDKHVSPPSKWIASRHKEKQAAISKRFKAENTDLQSEIDMLQKRLDLVAATGVKVPDTPLDLLSEEKLKDVRDEHGDVVADMFLAIKASIPDAVKPAVKPKAPAVQTDPDVGDERIVEIMQDEHLAYWSEERPDLWEKAIVAEADLAIDPKFMSLTYPEQAEVIVNKVKESVLAEKKPPKTDKEKKDAALEPPSSLSGVSGVAPASTDNKSLADRMIGLAESGEVEKAMELYDALPDGDDKLKFESWME